MQEPILTPYMDRIEAFYSCDLDISGEYTVFTSQFANDTQNMDKVKIMDLYEYERAIAIGDMGSTDYQMARSSDVVFARDELAEVLGKENIPYNKWETFYDILPLLA